MAVQGKLELIIKINGSYLRSLLKIKMAVVLKIVKSCRRFDVGDHVVNGQKTTLRLKNLAGGSFSHKSNGLTKKQLILAAFLCFICVPDFVTY